MHIGHMDAQAFAASAAQEALDARIRAKVELTRRERLAMLGKLRAENAENPEFAVEAPFDPEEDGEAAGGGHESSGGSLNAKA